MKIKMLFPIISFQTKEMEVTDEQFDEIQNMSLCQKADFILKNADPEDVDWMNRKDIESALDVDYAWIKEVK